MLAKELLAPLGDPFLRELPVGDKNRPRTSDGRSERYGVDYKLQTCGFADAVADDPCLFIEIEELYHSRIISLALRNVGLDAEMLPPSQITQLSLRLMMLLPHAISDIIILSAEVAGVTVFRMLAEKARELFSQTPDEADSYRRHPGRRRRLPRP